MKKSTILLVSLLPIILFSSYTSTIKEPASKSANKDCESLSLVYEDALTYFENYKGEKKVKKTLMGTSSINGYNINLWDAKKVELSIINISNTYTVSMRILSKKMN